MTIATCCDLIAFTLTQAGFLVVKAADGTAALQLFERESPDLVVLDINMPGASGFQVCEAIRTQSRVPIMMLTVRGEEEDLVRALELGADDYLTKPFSPRTLLARIKALLRRAGMENSAPLAAGRVSARRRGAHRAIGGGGAGAPDQARAAAAADAAGECRPHASAPIGCWCRSGATATRGDRQLLKQLVHRLRQKIEADPAAPAAAADRRRRGLQAGRRVSPLVRSAGAASRRCQ